MGAPGQGSDLWGRQLIFERRTFIFLETENRPVETIPRFPWICLCVYMLVPPTWDERACGLVVWECVYNVCQASRLLARSGYCVLTVYRCKAVPICMFVC